MINFKNSILEKETTGQVTKEYSQWAYENRFALTSNQRNVNYKEKKLLAPWQRIFK